MSAKPELLNSTYRLRYTHTTNPRYAGENFSVVGRESSLVFESFEAAESHAGRIAMAIPPYVTDPAEVRARWEKIMSVEVEKSVIHPLNVTVGDGKYTVIQEANGRLRALRYGEPWPARDDSLIGDNLVLALAQEVQALREKIDEMKADALDMKIEHDLSERD